MTIQLHRAVGFHYTLTDDTGTELDSSSGRDTMTYIHGLGMIIPGSLAPKILKARLISPLNIGIPPPTPLIGPHQRGGAGLVGGG